MVEKAWIVVHRIDDTDVEHLTKWWDEDLTNGIDDNFSKLPESFQVTLVTSKKNEISTTFCVSRFTEEPSQESLTALSELWASSKAGSPVPVLDGDCDLRAGVIKRPNPGGIEGIGNGDIGRSIIKFISSS